MTQKVINRLIAAHAGLEAALPALLTLIDVPVSDPEWQALDPAQRRRRTLEAVRRVLLGAAADRPLCIVLENLHWIDSETQVFLDSFVDSLPSHRILLVVTYRPEYRHPWASRSDYAQVTLDPLTVANVHHLIRSLVGEDESLRPVYGMLVERAGGNPLFLEELIRALVETHVLVGERGAYRLTNPLPSRQVPPTVQAVLAARMDRLSPADKALLQSAAVIGKDVPFALLEAVAGLESEAPRRSRSAPVGGVSLRARAVPRPRVQLHARADARRRLCQPAARATPHPSSGRGAIDRDALPGSARRARGCARRPFVPRRAVVPCCLLSHAVRAQSVRALRAPRGGCPVP